jgi:hypothetical protein
MMMTTSVPAFFPSSDIGTVEAIAIEERTGAECSVHSAIVRECSTLELGKGARMGFVGTDRVM